LCYDALRTVSQLADANETSQVLVEDLKSTTVFFWLARITESTRSI
jgi:hypothetical protein